MKSVLTRLSDIADIEVGYAFKSKEFSRDASGVRLLRGDNIGQGSVRWNHTERWPPDRPVPSRYELQPADVVLAMDRPWVGAGLKFARIRETDLPAYLVQRVARIRAKDGTDQNYLSAVLAGRDFTDYILSVQTGTSIPHISGRQIGDFPLQPHTLIEQRAIAEVLGALDDKLAANTNLINTADELSHAIYRTMADCSSPVPLSDTAQFINGKAFTKGASGTGRVVVRIAELNSGIGGSTVYSEIDVPDQHLARPGDLLFAWSGSLTLHRWFRKEAIINQHIFKVIPNAGYPMWLVYELVRQKLDEFKAIAADKATTMGHIQRRNLDEPVVVPAQSAIDDNNELMTALWEQGLAAQEEILKLDAIRKALLPHLISERLGIKQAEKLKSQWLDNNRRIAGDASRFETESLTT